MASEATAADERASIGDVWVGNKDATPSTIRTSPTRTASKTPAPLPHTEIPNGAAATRVAWKKSGRFDLAQIHCSPKARQSETASSSCDEDLTTISLRFIGAQSVIAMVPPTTSTF